MDVVKLPDAPPDTAAPRPPARRLWQAPAFVLGLAALVGAWCARPYLSNHKYICGTHELAAARADLDGGHAEPAATADLLHSLLDRGAVPPERAAEAHFLYGTALIRLAERASPALALDHWKNAREQLETAEQLGVPAADQDKLAYRLAKAGFYTGADPAAVAERLAAAIPSADGEAEGWHLLTQAYLRLTPPNLQAALDANERLRKMPSVKISDEMLAAARLTGGELLLRLQQPEDARKVLELVREAPAEIVTRARVLRARSYEDEQKWDEAANVWNAARAEAPTPILDAAHIRYHIGLCFRQLDQPLRAAEAWEEGLRDGSGDEPAAAAAGLAELHVQAGKDGKALERMEFALRNVHKPDEWDNKLLDRGKLCELCERCCQAARQANKFELALKLAELYERVAPPGRALVMSGDLCTDWAKARREAARKVSPESAGAEEQAVRRLFVRAAEAYESAVKKTPAAPEVGDRLWLATRRYLDAGEQERSKALLERLFELAPRPDDRLGEGWFLLGESYRQAVRVAADRSEKLRAADDAYRTCLQFQTPFLYRARYQLALFALERGDVDDAVNTLQQNLDQIPGRDDEVKERSRLKLAHIYYKVRKDYDTVMLRLEEVRDRLPANKEGTVARYELADSYRELADHKAAELDKGSAYRDPLTRARQAESCNKLWTRAVEEFERLMAVIENAQTANYLDEEQTRNVYYSIGLTAFKLRDFEKSLRAYERMKERYHHTMDYWTAVAGVISSYSGLGDNKKVEAALPEILDNLDRMDSETKQKMQKYAMEVRATLPPPPRPQPQQRP